MKSPGQAGTGAKFLMRKRRVLMPVARRSQLERFTAQPRMQTGSQNNHQPNYHGGHGARRINAEQHEPHNHRRPHEPEQDERCDADDHQAGQIADRSALTNFAVCRFDDFRLPAQGGLASVG